jgi:hypothetical protein
LQKDSGLGDREELPHPSPAFPSGVSLLPSPALVAALRQVHAEAGALHHAVGLLK